MKHICKLYPQELALPTCSDCLRISNIQEDITKLEWELYELVQPVVVKTLGDLRKALELLPALPDSVEVAIDDGEEFRDFELKFDGDNSISFKST